MKVVDVLRQVDFGKRVAEEEVDQLATYFVETESWRKVLADKIDIIYGAKGSGKSALFSLLYANIKNLEQRRILIATAENPRGAPAFKSIVKDPPTGEEELNALWKLYLCCILSATLSRKGIKNKQAEILRRALEESGLSPREKNLQTLLRSVLAYVRRLLRPTAVETSIKVDQNTLRPTAFATKIIFDEPSPEETAAGIFSVDSLLQTGNEALLKANYSSWILLDRLDVAFSDSPDLEGNALRALFRVYLDNQSNRNIKLKIFLRTDIWKRITEEGFREGSHITKSLILKWDRNALLNLIIKRAVQNDPLVKQYNTNRAYILRSLDTQEKFFYKAFPKQVDVGPNKLKTFDWLLSRTRDGTGQTAPRELIHLLNEIRDEQVNRLEIGENEPSDSKMFNRTVFKEALKAVSETRLNQTLYSEYPKSKEWIEKLRGLKTQHTIGSLSKVWDKSFEEAKKIVRKLVDIGFFELRDPKSPKYWVPFLYRDALEMLQGAADKTKND